MHWTKAPHAHEILRVSASLRERHIHDPSRTLPFPDVSLQHDSWTNREHVTHFFSIWLSYLCPKKSSSQEPSEGNTCNVHTGGEHLEVLPLQPWSIIKYDASRGPASHSTTHISIVQNTDSSQGISNSFFSFTTSLHSSVVRSSCMDVNIKASNLCGGQHLQCLNGHFWEIHMLIINMCG